MPKVPEFNKKPLRLNYHLNNPEQMASYKQKNYIATLCERRKIPTPDMKGMTKEEAAHLISSMVDN